MATNPSPATGPTDPATIDPLPGRRDTAGRYSGAAELLRALAHPARLHIVVELGEQEHCVHELVDRLGLAQPSVSQHLQVLRAARVVTGRREGREMRYTLADHHIAHIAADAIAHAHEPDPPIIQPIDQPIVQPVDQPGATP